MRVNQQSPEPEDQNIRKQSNLKKIPSNWVNSQTLSMIYSLSFEGYILAGNCIANMAQKIPIKNDLDFWANQSEDYINALQQISQYYDQYSVYPSMIQMRSTKGVLPPVNLIYTNLSDQATISRFDFDYCRCYWTPLQGIVFGQGCYQSIMTKVIKNPSSKNKIWRKRILKAIKYGYTFTQQFWGDFQQLLLCSTIKNHHKNWSKQSGIYPVRIQDLDMRKFAFREAKINVTNVQNINQTIKQIAQRYEAIAQLRDQKIRLPKLLTLNKSQKQLLLTYAHLTVLQNPLSDAHYMQIKISNKFISYYPRRVGQQQQVESQSSQSSSIQYQSNPKQLDKKIKIIYPEKGQQVIVNLNESGSAYLKLSYISDQLANKALQQYDKMWRLHPKQKHKIIMFQKQVQVSRYSQSYLSTPTDLSHTKHRSYMYSGYDTSNNKIQLPIQFQPFYDYFKKQDNKYNQVIANWYEDEQDYIALHSDCQRGMIPNSDIALLSLYPSNVKQDQYRQLKIIPRKQAKQTSLCDIYKILLDHGLVVKMCGTLQNQFMHGVQKATGSTPSRISLSFRMMKQEQ